MTVNDPLFVMRSASATNNTRLFGGRQPSELADSRYSPSHSQSKQRVRRGRSNFFDQCERSLVQMEFEETQGGKPFKITDVSRDTRKGVVAESLEDLTSKVRDKLKIENNENITVVLETDGTEIDDEEYFATLDPNTSLMILREGENWLLPKPPCRLNIDQVDDDKGGQELVGLVGRLKDNLCHLSLLGGAELELLSDMDPESLVDITFPDRIFLENLKEASGRYLCEKRQAQDAMELLRLYQEKETDGGD